jgi:hypothetical protein
VAPRRSEAANATARARVNFMARYGAVIPGGRKPTATDSTN